MYMIIPKTPSSLPRIEGFYILVVPPVLCALSPSGRHRLGAVAVLRHTNAFNDERKASASNEAKIKWSNNDSLRFSANAHSVCASNSKEKNKLFEISNDTIFHWQFSIKCFRCRCCCWHRCSAAARNLIRIWLPQLAQLAATHTHTAQHAVSYTDEQAKANDDEDDSTKNCNLRVIINSNIVNSTENCAAIFYFYCAPDTVCRLHSLTPGQWMAQ